MPTPKKETENNTPLTPAVFHILLALSEGDLHGYAIMNAVEEATEPSIKMGPGTIYGSLQRMEEAGLVEDRGKLAKSRRRLYGITDSGRKALSAESRRIARIAEIVHSKGLVTRET